MRIIKLSQADIDFPDRSSVDEYFDCKLPRRKPAGQFLFTKRRIAGDGISYGEPLVFSYKTEITHIAKAASGRLVNSGSDGETYPFYFLIDIGSICPAQASLADVEAALASVGIKKNLVRSQGWPRVPDTPVVTKIWNHLLKKGNIA